MEQAIISDALDNLRVHQRQLDADGIEAGVSRQALNEVIRHCGEQAVRIAALEAQLAARTGGVNVEPLLIECLDILNSLIENIKRHGNYSPESTCVYIDQAGSCIREALSTLSPAPEAQHDPETHPDNAPASQVLAYLFVCANSWEPEARIIGNARAGDIVRALSDVLPILMQPEAQQDPHEVLHVYDGDGGVIIRENGNISTFGAQTPAVLAAFESADTPEARQDPDARPAEQAVTEAMELAHAVLAQSITAGHNVPGPTPEDIEKAFWALDAALKAAMEAGRHE